MKHFAVVREHLDFFHQHHFIEFEDLLGQAEIEGVKKEIDTVLATRLGKTPEALKRVNHKALFMAGFDIWRASDAVKKTVLNPLFAEIASQLTKKRVLRIGYDQAFYGSYKRNDPSEEMLAMFKNKPTLSQISCLQGVVCGLILHLSSPAVPAQFSELSIQNDVQALTPLPRKAGSGLFFTPDIPLSFEYLSAFPEERQLLIVYAENKAIYYLNPEAPHTHVYKKMGYVFGDLLKQSTHPVLYRG